MPWSRDAVSTIKGYYYQFDHYILQLLSLTNDDDAVRIEGIEDVDIITGDITNAVQCKYYDGTRCSPSEVGKAVRPMLRHFSENKNNPAKYRYSLYGHYSSGEESIDLPLTVDYAKQKLFTYTEKGNRHVFHDELGLTDAELAQFITQLVIRVDAVTYETQIEDIISLLQTAIHCTEYDARYFYYNNAVSFVKGIAVKKTQSLRTITKKCFLNTICNKRALFDRWYIERIGFENYFKAARKEFFTQANTSPVHRFFLIDCDNIIDNSGVAEVVMKISEKWSKLSQRERTPFCPYLFLNGITSFRLSEIKKILLENDFHIWDGYEYKDAPFVPASLSRSVNYHIGIRAKIINKAEQISSVLESCTGQKKVYQFFLSKPFYHRGENIGNEFQIQCTTDVLKII